jgi:glycerol-1-phosphate dehydrogenase [NAD(P)+]
MKDSKRALEHGHDILDRSFKCQACGKTHEVSTKKIFYNDHPIPVYLEYLSHLNSFTDCFKDFPQDANQERLQVFLIADKRTSALQGATLLKELKKKFHNHQSLEFKEIILSDDQKGNSPECTFAKKEFLSNQIAKNTVRMIAIGSGVINDLCKWVAFEKNIPYDVFATAPSMNGYLSANVAANIEGVKTLVLCRPPEILSAEKKIIENAPMELITAGLGDVIAKIVSSADWKLNHLLFDEYYCQFAVNLTAQFESFYFDQSHKIAKRDPEAIEALFMALTYSGLAMTITGTSSPASGGEHLLSHALDMLSHTRHKQHDLHGRQVGIGVILSQVLYQKFFEDLAKNQLVLRDPSVSIAAKINYELWESLSPEVEKYFDNKREKLAKVLGHLQGENSLPYLQAIQTAVSPLLSTPQKIKKCLKEAKGAHLAQDIGVTREEFIEIWPYVYQMRNRFTILDLANYFYDLSELAPLFYDEWLA